MHFEILVEDNSGKTLLEHLVPRILGDLGQPHTWRLHPYKGIGKIPRGLKEKSDPKKRILLDQLPRLLAGYGQTSGIDAVIVLVDSDRRECTTFLAELKALLAEISSAPNTLFRLAIEEIEAWYFGDHQALLAAYPRAKKQALSSYKQDSVIGTWERLAEAIYPGGFRAIQSNGVNPGAVKHEWAERIGPHMDINKNNSPSFNKFKDGLLRLAGS